MDLMVPGIPVPLGARSTAPAARLVWGEPAGLFVDWVNHSLVNKGGGKDWSGEPFDKFTKGRTSTATYFDSNGVMQTAASGVPRYDYNPTTLAPRGYLKEGGRTNLLKYSADYSNVAWQDATSPTVTANTTAAPDGTVSADTLTAGSTSQQSRQIITGVASTAYAGSWYLKAGTSPQSRLNIFDFTASSTVANTNITWTGSVPSIAAGSTGTWTITLVGNGWYRIVGSGLSGASASPTIGHSIYPDNSVGTGSVIVWGAQLEAGSFASSYIPTTSAQVTRAGDTFSVATSLLGWWDATQVSMRLNGEYVGAGGNQYPLTFNDGSIANEVGFQLATGMGFCVRIGAADQANITGSPANPFAWAGRAAANDFAFYQSGVSVGTDTSGSMPVGITTLSGDAGTESFVWYRDAVLVPRLWSASELAARSVVS